MTGAGPTVWENALLAAAVHTVMPTATGGIRLRAYAGPVRDKWLVKFQELQTLQTPMRRIPVQIADNRLLGGLDLAATLQQGRPVAEKGLLAEANDGFILLAMAERMEKSTAAKIAVVVDQGMVTTERDGLAFVSHTRFGLIALDEGIDDEEPPNSLTERLGLVVDLRGVSHREMDADGYTLQNIAEAKSRLASIEINEEVTTAICAASMALGVDSLRAAMHAIQTARALAALAGRSNVSDEDVANAAMMVLSPKATQVPQTEMNSEASPEEAPDNEDRPPQQNDTSAEDPDNEKKEPTTLEDVVLDAAIANISLDLLAALKLAGAKGLARASGKSGQIQKKALRGRIIGSRQGSIRGNAKLDVIATLRSAAPWQNFRRRYAPTSSRILVRSDDFRIAQYRQRSQTCTIFVVDASGSSALQRLAEAKGAIRLLLAECYIRRDEVALISFRGASAEILMPPTRALVRAQRALAALPGGGGTPLAAGIDSAIALASAVQRNGHTPTIVFMSDARANVCRDGSGGRNEAQAEARSAARSLAAMQINTILIDTSPKPQQLAAELAALMGGRYVPLPHANAQHVAQAVGLLQKSTTPKVEYRGAA